MPASDWQFTKRKQIYLTNMIGYAYSLNTMIRSEKRTALANNSTRHELAKLTNTAEHAHYSPEKMINGPTPKSNLLDLCTWNWFIWPGNGAAIFLCQTLDPEHNGGKSSGNRSRIPRSGCDRSIDAQREDGEIEKNWKRLFYVWFRSIKGFLKSVYFLPL